MQELEFTKGHRIPEAKPGDVVLLGKISDMSFSFDRHEENFVGNIGIAVKYQAGAYLIYDPEDDSFFEQRDPNCKIVTELAIIETAENLMPESDRITAPEIEEKIKMHDELEAKKYAEIEASLISKRCEKYQELVDKIDGMFRDSGLTFFEVTGIIHTLSNKVVTRMIREDVEA